MKKIRKAVIPAAGLGTRILPASKSTPKEMLPIVDKPAIQYIVEEAVAAGIEEILIITNRGKGVIEDHFDHSIELEYALKNSKKYQQLEQVERLANLANITFIRQGVTGGLGHAILKAKAWVDDEPFAVLYGDDVIIGEVPAIGELVDVYNEYGLGVAGVKKVSKEQITKYCSLDVEMVSDTVMKVTDMIEKPSPYQIMSLYSILGRVILPPKIFEILENIPKGAGNELQLTDAMRVLARNDGMMGIEFSGTRYDMGNKLSFMQANVEMALKNEDFGADFKKYIKELAKTLD
ncbi:MAG: UTP--glucose-1-phosphate uridylyltransferase GalU [Clostridia bacterium]|nr:UTP--glucose-1-phosphate uridylyltransferase GalU [Clostridia bacterium]